MAITLTDYEHAAKTVKSGDDLFALAPGEKVRVQKQVGGETVDVLALTTCPAGKSWSVRVIVEITET